MANANASMISAKKHQTKTKKVHIIITYFALLSGSFSYFFEDH